MYWRWLLWLVFVVAWTWALLTPDPAAWARALIFPEGPTTGDVAPFHQQLLLIILSNFFSKALHVTGYAVLAALSAWLRLAGRHRWWLVAFLSVHALGTEFGQGFQPTRHPSWSDVGLDHVGLALGLVLTWSWWWKGFD